MFEAREYYENQEGKIGLSGLLWNRLKYMKRSHITRLVNKVNKWQI